MIAKVRDVVRCRDFPGIEDTYMIGMVTKVEGDVIHCDTIKTVSMGEEIQGPPTFYTQQEGAGWMDELFPNRVKVVG